MVRSEPHVQQLRLTPDRGRADQRGGRQTIERRRRVGGMAVRAEDQRITGIFPLQRAGQHDAGGHLGFQVFQAMCGEIHLAVHQRFMNFLGEQSLPPISAGGDPCTRSPVVRIACSLEYAQTAQLPGQKVVSRCKKNRVCTSASGDPRVPTRSGRARKCGFMRGGPFACGDKPPSGGAGAPCRPLHSILEPALLRLSLSMVCPSPRLDLTAASALVARHRSTQRRTVLARPWRAPATLTSGRAGAAVSDQPAATVPRAG